MSGISTTLRPFLLKKNTFNPAILLQSIQCRNSSFKSSPFIKHLGEVNIKYEISSNPDEWKYVERAMPLTLIPKPILRDEYPSEWKPPFKEALKLPYFVNRSKNYMLPVYMQSTYRGMRRLTYIKKVQGDIWLLEKEIKEFLQEGNIKPIRTQVHELNGQICIHGDHVNAVKHWLLEKKF